MSIAEPCWCKMNRDTECADCGTDYVMISHEEITRNREYISALEATRRDLWGVNEELREKIGALERGQLALIEKAASVGVEPIHE